VSQEAVIAELEAVNVKPGPDRARREVRSLPATPRLRRRQGSAFARPSVVLAVAAGGAFGSPARYGVGLLVAVPAGTFPWATFWVNLSGSLVLGALLALVIDRWPPNQFVRPFFATGFIGAYTTWSTFTVEADQLYAHGHAALATTYVGTSLVGGLVAVYVGMLAIRVLPAGRGGSAMRTGR
jgi:fluoride exporter